MPVQDQCMVGEVETQSFCRLMLQRLDRRIRELFHAPAVYTDDMVMMLTPVQRKRPCRLQSGGG
jgi:hypothetical protein